MRKYQTEFGLNVYTNYKAIISPSQLESFESSTHQYHIYGILLAAKYFLLQDSVTQYVDHIELILFANAFGKHYEYPVRFSLGSHLNHNKIKIDSVYPYSVIRFKIEDEEWLAQNGSQRCIEATASELFDFFLISSNSVDKVEYKVLYIGQSYGKRGERSAIERLSSHETLQKILIDAQRVYSEYDIKIMLLEMAYRLNTGIVTKNVTTQKNNEEDNQHIKSTLMSLPIEQQVINITEAAIINYFKPIYNEKFVENFPSDKHKSYNQYYKLDYDDLVIELDMEFESFPFVELFSDNARIESVWTFIHYKLDKNAARDSIYTMFN